MDSLCHPWFTTTNLSYRFPIFETSATALCGTTGELVIYIYIIYVYRSHFAIRKLHEVFTHGMAHSPPIPMMSQAILKLTNLVYLLVSHFLAKPYYVGIHGWNKLLYLHIVTGLVFAFQKIAFTICWHVGRGGATQNAVLTCCNPIKASYKPSHASSRW